MEVQSVARIEGKKSSFFSCRFERDLICSGQNVYRARPKETQGKDLHLGVVATERTDRQEGQGVFEIQRGKVHYSLKHLFEHLSQKKR